MDRVYIIVDGDQSLSNHLNYQQGDEILEVWEDKDTAMDRLEWFNTEFPDDKHRVIDFPKGYID